MVPDVATDVNPACQPDPVQKSPVFESKSESATLATLNPPVPALAVPVNWFDDGQLDPNVDPDAGVEIPTVGDCTTRASVVGVTVGFVTSLIVIDSKPAVVIRRFENDATPLDATTVVEPETMLPGEPVALNVSVDPGLPVVVTLP